MSLSPLSFLWVIYISHFTLVVLHNCIGDLICNFNPSILCLVFLFAVVSSGYFHHRLDCLGIHILLHRVSVEPFSSHIVLYVCMCAGALYWNRCFDFKQGSKFPCTQIWWGAFLHLSSPSYNFQRRVGFRVNIYLRNASSDSGCENDCEYHIPVQKVLSALFLIIIYCYQCHNLCVLVSSYTIMASQLLRDLYMHWSRSSILKLLLMDRFQVKKKEFFRNFVAIMLYGVVGVFISFAIISAGKNFNLPVNCSDFRDCKYVLLGLQNHKNFIRVVIVVEEAANESSDVLSGSGFITFCGCVSFAGSWYLFSKLGLQNLSIRDILGV